MIKNLQVKAGEYCNRTYVDDVFTDCLKMVQCESTFIGASVHRLPARMSERTEKRTKKEDKKYT